MSYVSCSDAGNDYNKARFFGKFGRSTFCVGITGLYLVKSAKDRKLEINTE
jgi:hypothetical protein